MDSCIGSGVAYVRRICFTASDQQVSRPCRDVPPRLVGKFVSAGSDMNVGKAINACASDIRSMSASFMKRDKNPKILMRLLPSKVCCFIVKAKLGRCTRTSEVSATVRILEDIFHRYNRYEINFAIVLVRSRALLIATCLLYTSPSPRDQRGSRMPSCA